MMLGGTPTEPCSYSFPYTDVGSFVNLTDVVNGLGPSAYIGAGAYITSKLILTVGAAIVRFPDHQLVAMFPDI